MFVFGGANKRGIPKILNSLRFRSVASSSLNRTPLITGSRTTWTWSAWVKRGSLGTTQFLFGANANASTGISISFQPTGAFNFSINGVGSNGTTSVFRDPSSWYHVVFAFDTTQSIQTNRAKLYINGVYQPFASFSLLGTQNSQYDVNTVSPHYIGFVQGGSYFDGYLSRVCFVDGQALDPTSFGFYDNPTIRWVSKSQSSCKSVVDGGGTNSFMLDFDNGTSLATLGADKSSKGNNWTPTNVSLTAGATYDWMIDTPTNNYCTLNPLSKATGGLGNNSLPPANIIGGNIETSASATTNAISVGTIAVMSGKWYWESTVKATSTGDQGGFISIRKITAGDDATGTGVSIAYFSVTGNAGFNGALTAYGTSYNTVGITVSCALDLDAMTVTFYRNNVAQPTLSLTTGGFLAGDLIAPMQGQDNNTSATQCWYLNFGQRPFTYTPPADYKALCTANLP